MNDYGWTPEEEDKVRRVAAAFRGYDKAHKKLLKARAERIWIENNPHIHLFNYPFYKFMRMIRGTE